MSHELSVIIPTRDRAGTLAGTLNAIATLAGSDAIEVVVVDDGSADDTAAAVQRATESLPLELRFVRRPEPGGPGAARNRGIEAATAGAVLFLGDDMRPTGDLLVRHLEHHRSNPGRTDGLLGRIVPSAASDSPFARWLHEGGKQFAFASIEASAPVPPRYFYAANCSLKRALVEEVGGFDERFSFGHEERELAERLNRAGLRLRYDPAALAEHEHPTDLDLTLRRMRDFGRSYRSLTDLLPGEPRPRRPGMRHRAKALALTAAAPARSARLRAASWEFLCDEAHREAFWGEPDPPAPAPAVRIGARLARIAARDPAVRSAGSPA